MTNENENKEAQVVDSQEVSEEVAQETEEESAPVEINSEIPVEESQVVDNAEVSEETVAEDNETSEASTPEATESDDAQVVEDKEVTESQEVSDQFEEGITIGSVIEAILFAADEPVPAKKLVEILAVGDVKRVKKHIAALNEQYDHAGRAFRIEQIAGGFQMLTKSSYNPWLSKLVKVRSESKLTPAGMETLAIVAYKQPIMRVDIEKIRGVAAGEMVRQLVDKGMVKITGRAEELGRPLLYGTTKKFLEVFGLNTIKDLPKPEDEKK